MSHNFHLDIIQIHRPQNNFFITPNQFQDWFEMSGAPLPKRRKLMNNEGRIYPFGFWKTPRHLYQVEFDNDYDLPDPVIEADSLPLLTATSSKWFDLPMQGFDFDP